MEEKRDEAEREHDMSLTGEGRQRWVTNLVRLLLVVDEVLVHVEQSLVVVHVLGQVGVSGVLLQEGVGC